MYGRIILKTAGDQAQFRTDAHDSIYDFLIEHGYTYNEAAEVASWAENAPVGEKYDLHDAEIFIIWRN